MFAKGRVHLILDTDEANPKVMELLEGSEEVEDAARKAIKLPYQHTGKLMMAR
jgi:hypothetical protein